MTLSKRKMAGSRSWKILRAVWRLVPTSARHVFWQRLEEYRIRRIARRCLSREPVEGSPIIVAGLLSAAHGVGASARSTIHALRSVGIAVDACDLTELFLEPDLDPEMSLTQIPTGFEGTIILHLNAPQMRAALKHIGSKAGSRVKLIPFWAWELPAFPIGWEWALGLSSEIWTPSKFAADAISKNSASPPVVPIPHAIEPIHGIETDRALFDLPEDAFIVVTMADAMSSFDRKNPMGAVDAFRKAFGNRSDCRLVVKTRNIDRVANARSVLMEAIGDAENVVVIDSTFSELGRWQLLACADCFLSLHRAEGFGMPIAETMALGKPVIATGWSGNLTFMTEATGYLVPYRLEPVEDRFGIYGMSDSRWAEPDIENAAQILRHLHTYPADCRRVGAAAANHIAEFFGPEAVGRKMAERLNIDISSSGRSGNNRSTFLS